MMQYLCCNRKKITLLFCILSVFCQKSIYTNEDIMKKNSMFEKSKISEDFFILGKKLDNKEKYNGNCCGVIIIGGGPAGLAAATYCARLGIKSTTIIMGPNPGGELMKTGVVENWPGIVAMEGKTIMNNTILQAKNSGANIIYEYVKEIIFSEWPFKVITNKNTYYTFSVMLATGSTIKKLECPGEEKYWGKGVSSCAVCDAPMHKQKTVIVVGGGDSACEEVLQLLPHVGMIYVLVRGEKMRASFVMQEKIKYNPKVKILYNTEIKEILGANDGVNDALLINKNGHIMKFSEMNEGPHFSGIFLAVGHYPNTGLVDAVIEKEANGLIKKIGATQKTSFPGLFCGGDVSNAYRQAGVASGEGAVAAIDIFNFLNEHNISAPFIQKYEHIWKTSMSNEIICENGVCLFPTVGNEKPIVVAPEKNVSPSAEMTVIRSFKKYEEIGKKNKDSFYIVDLFGTYCPACDLMKKTLQKYNKKNGHLSVYLINVEDVPQVASLYNVKSIPTILLMKNGKVITKKIGYMELDEFEQWITKNTK